MRAATASPSSPRFASLFSRAPPTALQRPSLTFVWLQCDQHIASSPPPRPWPRHVGVKQSKRLRKLRVGPPPQAVGEPRQWTISLCGCAHDPHYQDAERKLRHGRQVRASALRVAFRIVWHAVIMCRRRALTRISCCGQHVVGKIECTRNPSACHLRAHSCSARFPLPGVIGRVFAY